MVPGAKKVESLQESMETLWSPHEALKEAVIWRGSKLLKEHRLEGLRLLPKELYIQKSGRSYSKKEEGFRESYKTKLHFKH